MEVIFLLRPWMEKYREVHEDLHIVFIDLYYVLDRVPLSDYVVGYRKERNSTKVY